MYSLINQILYVVYTRILAIEIKVNGSSSHYESFIVNNSEEEINNFYICNINEFDGPLIIVTTVSSGQKMIRLKQFY